LLAGAARAEQQLQLAAAIEELSYDPQTGEISFHIQNRTGHKLISGFPEGRRMFINIKAYSGGTLVYEVNPYDAGVGTLKGLPAEYSPSSPPVGPTERHVDALVYEMHPKSDLTGEAETFHFALATGRYKDNRIPPRGFRIADAAARQVEPVWHGDAAPDYFTAEEYAGGYDEQELTIAAGADRVEVNLYYQTTSREYIEFLRDEITGTGRRTLSSPTPSGEPEAYVIQTDPFFSSLAAWGETIWQLWVHNRDLPGAAPYLMASASTGGAPPCGASTPTLLAATSGNGEITLTWSDEHAGNPGLQGYAVYYDQAGKLQLVAEVGLTTTYTDTGLTNGQQYCYRVSSFDAACESEPGNIVCATPKGADQGLPAGFAGIGTGLLQKTGKGKDATTTYVPADTFQQGDEVVIRATVSDLTTDAPLEGASVDLIVTDAAGAVVANLAGVLSDAAGVAQASWKTQAPNRKGAGGTEPGLYNAVGIKVTKDGYQWDGATVSTTFAVQ
jgi:hypothetical protein